MSVGGRRTGSSLWRLATRTKCRQVKSNMKKNFKKQSKELATVGPSYKDELQAARKIVTVPSMVNVPVP